MNKIYFTVNEQGLVDHVHYMPFDETHGLGKTEEELQTTGHLIEKSLMPEPENRPGFVPVLKFTDGVLSYEYQVAEKSPEEIKEDEMAALRSQNAEIIAALVEGGLM